MNDLVERMNQAWLKSALESHDPLVRMTAAAKVLLDAALGEPTEDEMIATARSGVNWAFGKGLDYDRVRDIFANRRARLLAPKTVEISVEYVSAHGFGWRVFADGDERGLFSNEADAQTFKAGLIAEMKEREG